MLKLLKSIIPAITLFAASHAQAQESPIKLEADVKAVVETIDENGQSRVELAKPGTIVPGDRILFGTNYTNTGTEPAENFTMTNPLPGQVRLAPDADPELIVSVDAGTTWGRLTELLVSEEDGTTRPARHGDVTHTGVSATDADSVVISDDGPTNAKLCFDTLGSGMPVVFTDGSPVSGLGLVYIAPGNVGDDVEFSNDQGVTWTYSPVLDADGCDQNITDFRILPSGQLNVGAGFTLQTSYPVR